MEEKLAATFVKKKQENRVLKTFKKKPTFIFPFFTRNHLVCDIFLFSTFCDFSGV